MATVDFTNLNPEKEKKAEKEAPDISLRGEVEFKKTPWVVRTARDMKRIAPYMFWKIAGPEMGRILWNTLVDAGERAIFGTTTTRRNSSRKDGQVVEYDGYFDKRDTRRSTREADDTTTRSYDEFLFTDQMDVDDIITAIVKQAKDDTYVSVSDLYFIIKRILKKADYPKEVIELLESPQYTDNDYGWSYDDLRSARPGSVRTNGRTRYFLDLPEAKAIRRR